MTELSDFHQHLDSAHQFAQALFDELREKTRDQAGGVTRASYGRGEQIAHELLGSEARKMGLEIDQDPALNTYMTRPGKNRSLPRIIIGSHLDSVACGGNYDGAAGVIAGLTALYILEKCNISTKHDITVMGIRAEESAWFQTSYIGSKAAFGLLKATALKSRRIDTGQTLAEHITELGGCPGKLAAQYAYLDPATIKAYVELHIEQAPSLIEREHPLAIGTAIPGNVRYPDIQVVGTTAHVGLPHRFRQDSLKAATEFVADMEALWRDWESAQKPMAFTVGRFHTDSKNDALTKVPGLVSFSVDMRAYDEHHLNELDQAAHDIARRLEERHKVNFEFGVRTSAAVAKADPALSSALTSLARKEGLPIDTLPSPASHDAAVFCGAGVPMALLLIRNEYGSHNPDEHMDMQDLMAGITILTRWLAQNH